MTVEPSYRYCPDPKFPTCMEMRCEVCDGEGYVLDGRLQAIKDAWAEYKTRASIGGEWTELAVLLDMLDALEGTDE